MGTVNRPSPWQYGDTIPVMSGAKLSAVEIAKGDLVAQAPGSLTGATSAASITIGTVYPASDQPWDTSLAVTQEAFHDAFLGCSDQRSASGQTAGVRTNTRGVHKFDCAATTWKVGDLVGPAKQSGSLLEDQKVVSVATANLAIGKVAKVYGTNTTTVLVEVFGVVTQGGVQVPA